VAQVTQKTAFSEGEGDAWFERNRTKLGVGPDEMERAIESLQMRPKRILEIGCSNGHRLEKLRARFNAECVGIDPSQLAIANGRVSYPNLSLNVGTADVLEFHNGAFDLVIFGFCLYLCDPCDYFRIAAEADRVLFDPGWLVIHDFLTSSPRRRRYSHSAGLYSHKMEFSRLITGNPAYRMLARRYCEHSPEFTHDPNEAVTLDILRKDSAHGFQE
jgi:ubiquinone/menaquinone biosynthesis C-methylase UbiE